MQSTVIVWRRVTVPPFVLTCLPFLALPASGATLFTQFDTCLASQFREKGRKEI